MSFFAYETGSTCPLLGSLALPDGSGVLKQYELFELDERSRVFRSAVLIEAFDDRTATEAASALLDRRPIEYGMGGGSWPV